MAETLTQDEAAPAAPPVPGGDGGDPAAWSRIESYITHRWPARAVVWHVRGPGVWVPPLRPVTALTAEIWNGGGWIDATVDAAPLGWEMTLEGPYRVTATVGDDTDPPADVLEAYRRLSTYSAEAQRAGVSRHSLEVGGVGVETERDPRWLAKAMQLSGAGDLLRPYRGGAPC